MADILTFRARRPAPTVSRTDVLDGPALRLELEQAAQAALDQAERLIALLDRMDGNADDEDGGDAEQSLGAPEGHASRIVWLRGSASDDELTS
ncbi:hypothetical protein [Methylorubrum extorquens]|uniref:Uncharacterized protein n=1 Tax=Methylorubrum extorquens (strain CM4 / NCIMB 13688) TaxID=440085 RepID=B7L3Q9_METC4|nr:hypothetical protein [Methylorubrum extorquens]ACK86467.1 hypothetical protein Mchl_5755 [Methylorubrum extorquens CM4]